MFVRAPLVFFQQVERVARVEGKGWFARDRHRCFPEVCIAAIVDNEEGGFVLHVGGEDEIVNVKVFHIRDRDVFLPIDRQRVAAVGGWEAEVSMSVSDRAVERGALQIGCGRAFDEDDLVVHRGIGARTADHLVLDRAAGDRDGVFRHGASFGIAAADPVSRAAGDRDGVARHGSIIGMAAVGLARDRAAGERDGVIRRGAVTRPAAVGISDRAGRHIPPVLFHRAALGPAAINNPIVGRAALDEYMVLREDICPPNKQV